MNNQPEIDNENSNTEESSQKHVVQNTYPPYPQQPTSSTSGLFIVGIIFIVLGIIGAIYSAITIISDIEGYHTFLGYSYSGHLTAHEITMIILAIVSTVILVLGIVFTVRSKIKK